jgi:hypothetical protein
LAGDSLVIVAVDLFARSLANLEGVTGQFYLAVTVARKVAATRLGGKRGVETNLTDFVPLEFPVFEPFELEREKPPGFTLEVPSDFRASSNSICRTLCPTASSTSSPWASLVSSPSQSKHAGARR